MLFQKFWIPYFESDLNFFLKIKENCISQAITQIGFSTSFGLILVKLIFKRYCVRKVLHSVVLISQHIKNKVKWWILLISEFSSNLMRDHIYIF